MSGAPRTPIPKGLKSHASHFQIISQPYTFLCLKEKCKGEGGKIMQMWISRHTKLSESKLSFQIEGLIHIIFLDRSQFQV